MILFIDKDSNRPLFAMEQILMIKEFSELHREYGLFGLYFVFLYAWKASPYMSESDLEKRAKQVKADIANREWYDESSQLTAPPDKRDRKPAFLSPENIVVAAAINKVAEFKVPLLEQKLNFEEYLERENLALSSEKDPDIRKKILANIKTLGDMMNKVEDEIERKLRQRKFASLNDFLELFQ